MPTATSKTTAVRTTSPKSMTPLTYPGVLSSTSRLYGLKSECTTCRVSAGSRGRTWSSNWPKIRAASAALASSST